MSIQWLGAGEPDGNSRRGRYPASCWPSLKHGKFAPLEEVSSRSRLACLVAAILLFAGEVVAAPYSCLPTCSTTDARFLAIAQGTGLATLTPPKIVLRVAVAAGAGSFTLGVFDGDGRGADGGGLRHWDIGTTDVPYVFTLFADPLNDGSGSTVVEIDPGFPSVASADMPDNDWRDFTIATSPAAQAPSGVYFYRLEIDAVGSFLGVNAFKLRSDGVVTVAPFQPVSFIVSLTSAADQSILYPSLPSPSPTTYDGTFSVFFSLSAPTTELAVWDGDFDRGKFDGTESDTDDPDTPGCIPGPPAGDAACGPGMVAFLPPWASADAKVEGVAQGGIAPSTGNPPDDRTPAGMGQFLLRSPSVMYELHFPDGQVFTNSNPSGNQEWEQFKIVVSSMPVAQAEADAITTSIPAGTYELRIIGLDLQNLNAIRVPNAALCVGEDGSGCVELRRFLLGDTVFADANGNGVQDSGDAGISGVLLELLDSIGGVIKHATTDKDGKYSFNVDAGTYSVRVAASNFSGNGVLVMLSSTTGGSELQRTVDLANVLTYDFGYAAPDPTIQKSHTGTFASGQSGQVFSLTVTNVGGQPTDGTAVSVTDTLPAGLTATAISGSGWSCTLATLSCTRTDVLAPGASYPVIVVAVNVATDAKGTLINVAKVGGGGDINLANNTDADPVAIFMAAVPALSSRQQMLLIVLLAAIGAQILRRRVERV